MVCVDEGEIGIDLIWTYSQDFISCLKSSIDMHGQ